MSKQPDKIEYRVREVKRYVVSRYCEQGEGAMGSIGSEVLGSFESQRSAYKVAYALCKAEHGELGWPLDDERIKYPEAID